MELIKGNVRVEWDSIGEGFSGSYNPDDPNDTELLRFYVSKRDGATEEWQDVEDASYCTCFSADANETVQMKALEAIMDRVYDKVINDVSIKKICEELSYLSEKNFMQQAYMPTRDDIIAKINNEGKALGDAANDNDDLASEIVLKRNILYELNSVPMSDDTIKALAREDNILDGAYAFLLKRGRDSESDAILAYLDNREFNYWSSILSERANRDYDARYEEISKLPPADIISSAYEIVILEDILNVLEFDIYTLKTDQLKALASLESPLWSIYNEWMRCDYSLMDDIRYIVGQVAVDTLHETDEVSFDPKNMIDFAEEYDDGMEP